MGERDDERMDGDAGDGLKQVGGLARLHAHCYWNLEGELSAVLVGLHLVSLQEVRRRER